MAKYCQRAYVLKEFGKTFSKNVVVGGIGAYAIDDDVDKYYLVQWMERPQDLMADQLITVENALTTVFNFPLWRKNTMRLKLRHIVALSH
jgi:hypothetical protein